MGNQQASEGDDRNEENAQVASDVSRVLFGNDGSSETDGTDVLAKLLGGLDVKVTRKASAEEIERSKRAIDGLTRQLDVFKRLELVTGAKKRSEEVAKEDQYESEDTVVEEEATADGDDNQESNDIETAVGKFVEDTTNQDEDEVEDPETRRQRKKENVIREIQASEQLYSQFLTTLTEQFIRPLREEKVLAKEQIDTIAANIESIAPYHKALAELLNNEDIASVFNQYAPSLKAYEVYVNNYERACQLIAGLKGHKVFQAFLAKRRGDPKCGGLGLMSYLIMPIQRIPRYKLLLEELKKYTREEDDDMILLDEALRKIEHIAASVNESKRLAESRSKIVEIQNRMSGEFENLLTPSRRLVHEGFVLLKKTLTNQLCHLYVFNDLIVWCTDSFQFLGVATPATCQCRTYEHSKHHGFVLSAPAFKDGLVFRTKSRVENIFWMDKIQTTMRTSSLPGLMSRDRAMSRRRRSEQLKIQQLGASHASKRSSLPVVMDVMPQPQKRK